MNAQFETVTVPLQPLAEFEDGFRAILACHSTD